MKYFSVLTIRFGNTVDDFVPFGVHEMLPNSAIEQQHSQRSKEQNQQYPIASASIQFSPCRLGNDKHRGDSVNNNNGCNDQ